jgi:3-oxoacyl-[acyl-carrier protein] reductase
MFDLTDRMALVTGATGGIGGAIARAFHKQGATVAVSGRQTEKLDKLAAELGSRVHVLPCDLGDRVAVGGLVDAAIGRMGRLDILVNNAGLTKDNLLMVMKDEQWDDVIAVNLTATFVLMRAAARAMMRAKTGYGRIVNISSVSGQSGQAGQANYAAAKAGLLGLTRAVARELAPRSITCNVVAPGPIVTAMTDALPDDWRAWATEAVPLGRLGTPDEVGAVVAFLCSDPASYVTGALVPVDGGLGMGH